MTETSPAGPEGAAPPRANVFKMLPRADWEAACRAGRYDGSPADAGDGFIHLSAAHQLAGTAGKHFAHIPDLLLVAIPATRLGVGLRWEPARGGDLFPHLYGPLDPVLALWVRPLTLAADGVPMIPEEVSRC
jgi:uncharacterized protein (DUF952 family)